MTVCTGDLLTGQGGCSCAYCRELRRRARANAPDRRKDDGPIASDEAWRDRAACKGKPVEWWFPVRESIRDHEARYRDEAKQLCAGCEVRTDCLAYAVTNHIHDGMWGGVVPKNRRGRQVA